MKAKSVPLGWRNDEKNDDYNNSIHANHIPAYAKHS